MDKKRNVAIDLLRVIAATLIVLHHYQQGVDITFEHIKFYGGTFNFAYLVELFFLISGVMVYKSVLDDHITFKEFMSRRTNRIIPLLAISVFVETILRYINDSVGYCDKCIRTPVNWTDPNGKYKSADMVFIGFTTLLCLAICLYESL